MSRITAGLPNVPRGIDRDLSTFLDAVRRALNELSKAETQGDGSTSSKEYSLRLDSKSRKGLIEQVNDVVATLDFKLENSITNKVAQSEQRSADANNQLSANLQQAMDDKIDANNAQLMIDIAALIDEKIAEQHPPP